MSINMWGDKWRIYISFQLTNFSYLKMFESSNNMAPQSGENEIVT
jgi:hypothetical protein